MRCLTSDLIKGLWEPVALSTVHAIFASKMHTSGFSACAQQCSMLTLASLSRVPVSTDTLGCSRVLGSFPSWNYLKGRHLLRVAPGCWKKALKKVFGAPFWACWNGIFSLFFLSFFGNSWIPISREFLMANFKSYRDFWSLDLSIAQCDCLIWVVDREHKNSVDREIKNSDDHENKKIPSIAR